MDEFISIDKLIKQAKSKGIDLGSGDPYNRLRYYTKIGWLPHMVRRGDKSGNIKGHYPAWSVDRLVLIENLKSQGVTNEEIAKKLKVKSKAQDFLSFLNSREVRRQIVSYLALLLLIVIFANEVGFINIGNSKDMAVRGISQPVQIYENGTAFVPKNQNKVFIAAGSIRSNSKVYVTFTQDYTPASRYWVSDIRGQQGFILELDAPVAKNVEFDWWLSN